MTNLQIFLNCSQEIKHINGIINFFENAGFVVDDDTLGGHLYPAITPMLSVMRSLLDYNKIVQEAQILGINKNVLSDRIDNVILGINSDGSDDYKLIELWEKYKP